mmetsp:Transcript_11424/g.22424  ORF Transcript_11424/g.22424 Transcript_11424/m.22424 type:complete len:200 (+) Transcript_11424:1152-1751(+)
MTQEMLVSGEGFTTNRTGRSIPISCFCVCFTKDETWEDVAIRRIVYEVIIFVLPCKTREGRGHERTPLVNTVHYSTWNAEKKDTTKVIIRVLQTHITCLIMNYIVTVCFVKNRIETNMRFDNRVATIKVVHLKHKVEVSMNATNTSLITKHNLVRSAIGTTKTLKHETNNQSIDCHRHNDLKINHNNQGDTIMKKWVRR